MEISATNICQTCHQPILPEYYFCPNCGAKLREAPLPTALRAQISLYIFSIILPMICFLFVTRWQGIKYLKSQDRKARQMGQIALTLLIISTIIIVWMTVIWTQNYIKSTVDSINADFNF
jgi:hypothetical protein